MEQWDSGPQSGCCRLTFVDEDENLCQVKGCKVPAVEEEEDLQRSGGELRERQSRKKTQGQTESCRSAYISCEGYDWLAPCGKMKQEVGQ